MLGRPVFTQVEGVLGPLDRRHTEASWVPQRIGLVRVEHQDHHQHSQHHENPSGKKYLNGDRVDIQSQQEETTERETPRQQPVGHCHILWEEASKLEGGEIDVVTAPANEAVGNHEDHPVTRHRCRRNDHVPHQRQQGPHHRAPSRPHPARHVRRHQRPPGHDLEPPSKNHPCVTLVDDVPVLHQAGAKRPQAQNQPSAGQHHAQAAGHVGEDCWDPLALGELGTVLRI
mmetsp:Transcript_22893/g.51783  ORF Transcript_22893/g.51783 Transcript_22893/m.51783 type:complete len:229 (+) Transcript_22893:852-1538(+)